ENLYGASVNPKSEITITAGATQALFTAITTFIKSGDEVILIEPAYDSYAPSIRLNGGKVIPYNLQGPSYKVQWEEFNTLITEQTKMIIINTPHNPTGQLLSANDIISLESIIRDKNIIVISDEVYEHLTYDGRTHESVLKYPCLRAKSFAVYSFGKTFHATGWKLGHIIGPKHLMHEFKKVHQFNVFCVNHPIQCAIADYMENKEVYQGLGPMFEKKRDLFLEIISKSKFKPVPCEGTYFQMVDYSEISDLDDIAFAKWITKEVGVAAIPVSVFYTNAPDQKVIRFCFAKTDDVLIEAGKKLFTL
ncbi:MAG: methionine aminotransferase, partial [Bacteroidota bacterium]